MPLRVATHNESFHADDVFAVAALTLIEDVEVLRTRDPRLLAEADLRVDVGLGNDPATGDYDHHQAGGAGQRPSGVPYASFGLIWRHYGARICNGDQDVADGVDRALVSMVDAHDNGMTLFDSRVDDLTPMTADRMVAAFNPDWDLQPTAADYDACFHDAVVFAAGVLRRAISQASAQARAARRVRAAIRAASDPRVVVLDRFMPWREVVVDEAPDVRLVVFPRQDGWAMQTVPEQLGDFTARLDLPADWAGLTGEDLAARTGVQDAVFCHAGRFFAAASSREGILALAGQALSRN